MNYSINFQYLENSKPRPTNTETDQDLNTEEKMTIRLEVSADEANEILTKIDAPTPDASEIDEIVLVIRK